MSQSKSLITPDFIHPEIKNLYQYSLDIPHEILNQILILPRKTLIEDLENILRDANKRFGYFVDQAQLGASNTFVFHALFLLRELKAEESLGKIIAFLKNDGDILDFWFGDHITETLWKVFYTLGFNKTQELKNFILFADGDIYIRSAASQALAQMSLHNPERKPEIQDIFKELLEYFNQANEDDEILDPDFIALFVGNMIDAAMPEFLPLIKELYRKDLVSMDVNGDFSEIEDEFSLQLDFKKPVPDIFDLYADVLKNWYDSQYLAAEDEESEIVQSAISEKIQRNEPCPCGSGKKYKKCCMKE